MGKVVKKFYIEGEIMKKNFLTIVSVGDETFLHKDVGMIPFTISKQEGWISTLAYLEEKEPIKNKEFEKRCRLISMGKSTGNWRKDRNIIINFIKGHISEYDVVNFYNYGSTVYKYAYYSKKYNPKILVYAKLDMSIGGFRHFYENSLIRKIKNYFERFKSKYIDLFSVETYDYYEKLKDNIVFKNRLIYIPNGVEFLKYDYSKLKKENILLHVARMGDPVKNSELLIESISQISSRILLKWKIYLIGPYTKDFSDFLLTHERNNKVLKDVVCLIGEIRDRRILYSYYKKAKLFCLTSKHESFGIAAIEALYHNDYLVLSNYGNVVKTITNNGEYGKVIDSLDSKIWAHELELIMSKENFASDNTAKMFVERNFNYNIIVGKLLKRLNYINYIKTKRN